MASSRRQTWRFTDESRDHVIDVRRPGRGWFLGPACICIAPWSVDVSVFGQNVFARVWPEPYVSLIVRLLGGQVSVSTRSGYIATADLRRIRYLWRRPMNLGPPVLDRDYVPCP